VDGIQIPLWVVAWLTCMQYGWPLEDAERVFNKMPSWAVVTWKAMIGTCAMWVRTESTSYISPKATRREVYNGTLLPFWWCWMHLPPG
jgi:hypothetical protein